MAIEASRAVKESGGEGGKAAKAQGTKGDG